jgi:GTP-binding protein
MTSQNPGKTILINHFIINDKWFLVDLPGYGYAKRGKAEMARLKKMIYSYIEGRETLYNLFVLIDSNIPPQKIDLEFIQWLGEHGVPFSIIFTKTDKKSKSEVGKNIAKFNQVLTETWEELPQQFMASAVKKTGRDEILNHIGDILKATKS